MGHLYYLVNLLANIIKVPTIKKKNNKKKIIKKNIKKNNNNSRK